MNNKLKELLDLIDNKAERAKKQARYAEGYTMACLEISTAVKNMLEEVEENA